MLSILPYQTPSELPKKARYYRMKPHAGSIEKLSPRGEVNKVLWVKIPKSQNLLSDDYDRELVMEVVKRVEREGN